MSLRVCPRPACAELCPPNAEICHTCGAALLPTLTSRPAHRVAVVLEQATELQAVAADADDDLLSRQVDRIRSAAIATGNRLTMLDLSEAS